MSKQPVLVVAGARVCPKHNLVVCSPGSVSVSQIEPESGTDPVSVVRGVGADQMLWERSRLDCMFAGPGARAEVDGPEKLAGEAAQPSVGSESTISAR